MSQTLFIEDRGHGFWAFDLVAAVFLKHLIDVAAPRASAPDDQWLVKAVANWRVNAVISDFGLFLDETWSEEQIKVLIELMGKACRLLEERVGIPAKEIQAWTILNDLRIYARGFETVPTGPVVRLGQAIISLLDGSLPMAPASTWWFYGIEDSPGTVERRQA